MTNMYAVEHPADEFSFSCNEYDTADRAYDELWGNVADLFIDGNCVVERYYLRYPEDELAWDFIAEEYIYKSDYLYVIADKLNSDKAIDEWISAMRLKKDAKTEPFFESAERVKKIVAQYDRNGISMFDMVHDACAGKNDLLNEIAFFALAFEDLDSAVENGAMERMSQSQWNTLEEEARCRGL